MKNDIPFTKMHGLGNDFVVFDARKSPLPLTAGQARRIADRRFGVGCDQVILIEPAEKAAAFMRIYNADGGEVDSCGNATRCVASLLAEETGAEALTLVTNAGTLTAVIRPDGQVQVDMGPPRLEWQEIPLSEQKDTLHLGIEEGGLVDPVGVSMGNPHAVFFVTDAEGVDLASLGPKLEHRVLFPQRANIGVAQVVNNNAMRLRVWERGAGETLACGTGACAALVAAVRRRLTSRKAFLKLNGGYLEIEWKPEEAGGHVLMTGPTAITYRGIMDKSLLDREATPMIPEVGGIAHDPTQHGDWTVKGRVSDF